MPFSAGNAGHIAEHNRIAALGTLGYAQTATSQTGITTELDLTGLSVTAQVTTGHRIRVTGYLPNTSDTVAGDVVILNIKEGVNTYLARASLQVHAAGVGNTHMVIAILTPSAGARTYRLSLSANAGTLTTNTDASRPAFILVEDIGA